MSSTSPHLLATRKQLPVDSSRSRERSQPGGLRLWMRVLLHRRRLDNLLLAGARPGDSSELALRSEQLTALGCRRNLADSLDEIVCCAEGKGRRSASAAPVASRDVRSSRAMLFQLAHVLRAETTPNPAGVVLVERLLTDGTGPLFVESENDALWRAAKRAIAMLER